MGVPPSPHLAAAVITSWGILGAIIDPVGEGTLAGNHTEFFWKPKISLKRRSLLIRQPWPHSEERGICDCSVKRLRKKKTAWSCWSNQWHCQMLSEMTAGIPCRDLLLLSHLSACSNHITELRFCEISVCCYRPGNTHQNQPFQQEFVQLSLLHQDCRKTERTLFHLLPKWINFPLNGAFHLSSFQQLGTILPWAPLTSPPLPAHSSEEPSLPRNQNTCSTHRHLCKHLTQNQSSSPDFHLCPEMEPVSHRLPQGYVIPTHVPACTKTVH